jgi:hypothetical protein
MKKKTFAISKTGYHVISLSVTKIDTKVSDRQHMNIEGLPITKTYDN